MKLKTLILGAGVVVLSAQMAMAGGSMDGKNTFGHSGSAQGSCPYRSASRNWTDDSILPNTKANGGTVAPARSKKRTS